MQETIEYKGINWKKYHRSLIPLVAPDVEIQLTKEEGLELLKKTGTDLLRYTSHFDNTPSQEFWYVIKEGPVDIKELSSNMRNQVRKGLKNCKVSFSDKEEIAQRGYRVYQKAFESYRSYSVPLEENAFSENIRSLDEKEWDFWKVEDLESGELLAYSRNRIMNNTCTYSEIKLDPTHLKKYPSYGLIHTMNEHYLNDRQFRFVNDGPRSIAHDSNVQSFLIKKFKFRKACCNLHVVYKPWVRTMVSFIYPFRKFFSGKKHPKLIQLNTLLIQEEILRKQRKGL